MSKTTQTKRLLIDDVLEEYKTKATDFVCIVCNYISIDPLICKECNCLTCKECISNQTLCPLCRKGVGTEPLPKFSQRSLFSIKFNCDNKGCPIQPDYYSYDDHSKNCEFGIFKCSYEDCEFKDFSEKLKEHKKICPEAIVDCAACKSKVKRKFYDYDALYKSFESNFKLRYIYS